MHIRTGCSDSIPFCYTLYEQNLFIFNILFYNKDSPLDKNSGESLLSYFFIIIQFPERSDTEPDIRMYQLMS